MSLLVRLAAVVAVATQARAAELGHYNPGIPHVRDWLLPDKEGLYYLTFNFLYRTSELKDFQGNSELSDLSINSFVSTHNFIWRTNKKFVGADVAFLVAPEFGSQSQAALLNAQGRPTENFSARNFGFGDLTVRPVFLGWSGRKYDFATSYQFVAPTGKYSTGSPANVGLGMWSHQFIGTAVGYTGQRKKTAYMLSTVYEVNTSQRGLDDIPGSNLGFEYGISHLLNRRVEIGLGGFAFLQATNDSGTDAVDRTNRNRLNGVGPQINVWPVAEKMSMGVRAIWEYGARGRFQGYRVELSLFYVF
jgi:hypothetical protein